MIYPDERRARSASALHTVGRKGDGIIALQPQREREGDSIVFRIGKIRQTSIHAEYNFLGFMMALPRRREQ